MQKTKKPELDRRNAARHRARRRREAAIRKKKKRTAAIRRAKTSRRSFVLWTVAVLIVLGGVAGAAVSLVPVLWEHQGDRAERPVVVPDWVDVQLVDINGHGRRGAKLERVNDIVVHYVGNPGTTAHGNRDFFNQPDTAVSAHFVVGLEGEIIQCIPLDEKSSASNHRNHDTISIEVCHPDKEGAFADETYRALVKLTAWLCGAYGLDGTHVIRHYDVTGKPCPLYYVEHPEAWERFVAEVDKNR